MEYLPLVALVLIFWFLILRPQRRRNMQQNALWAGLEVGQEVVTTGGLYGRIRHLDDEAVQLEISPETVVKVDRRAVARRVDGGSAAADRR